MSRMGYHKEPKKKKKTTKKPTATPHLADEFLPIKIESFISLLFYLPKILIKN